MLVRNRSNQLASMLHVPVQLDLFPPPPNDRAEWETSQTFQHGGDPLQRQRLLEARQGLLRAAQLRLAGPRLWGFLNLIRNPDGPWKEYYGSVLDVQAHLGCSPTNYILRLGRDKVHRFTIRVRAGRADNPAIPRAAETMATLAPATLAVWDGTGDSMSWTRAGTMPAEARAYENRNGIGNKGELTGQVFNPIVGCTKVSLACDRRYTDGWAKRTGNAVLWQGEHGRTKAKD